MFYEKLVNDKGVVDLQIMIVEDEFIIALDLKDTVTNLGYSVPRIATSGKEAVKLAAQYKPDLILMDIMLKGEMDGVDAAREINTFSESPIIFISSFSDKKSIERASSVSNFGYLLKPFSKEELKTAIEDALRKYEEKNYRSFMTKYSTTARRGT